MRTTLVIAVFGMSGLCLSCATNALDGTAPRQVEARAAALCRAPASPPTIGDPVCLMDTDGPSDTDANCNGNDTLLRVMFDQYSVYAGWLNHRPAADTSCINADIFVTLYCSSLPPSDPDAASYITTVSGSAGASLPPGTQSPIATAKCPAEARFPHHAHAELRINRYEDLVSDDEPISNPNPEPEVVTLLYSPEDRRTDQFYSATFTLEPRSTVVESRVDTIGVTYQVREATLKLLTARLVVTCYQPQDKGQVSVPYTTEITGPRDLRVGPADLMTFSCPFGADVLDANVTMEIVPPY